MTEFEKAIKPYEKWVNAKLDQIVPRPDKITPEMCAAMIAQYQRELASDGDLADVRFSVPEILGLKDSWDLVHILQKLIEASDILLTDKDYDGHGWELIKEARDKAESKVLQISGNEI